MTHIIFLISFFFTLPYINKKYPSHIITFIILFLFLALRYDYGNDYMSYYYIHEAVNYGLSVWGENDILYKTLNLLIPNYYWFITVISLFYIIVIYCLIKNNLQANKYWFATLILLINPYLFLIHLSSLRQTIAICFFILAVIFGIKRNIFMYYLFNIVAIGFHSSAILLLPLYFLLNESKINKEIIVFICVLILVLLFTPLYEKIVYVVLKYLPRHYNYYYEQGFKNSLRATMISSYYFFLTLLNINKLENKEIIYGKLYLIATILSILAVKSSMISRIGMYFDIFSIITIPHIFSKIKMKANKHLLFIIMLIIYLLRYYSFFTNPLWESYVKYKTILSK